MEIFTNRDWWWCVLFFQKNRSNFENLIDVASLRGFALIKASEFAVSIAIDQIRGSRKLSTSVEWPQLPLIKELFRRRFQKRPDFHRLADSIPFNLVRGIDWFWFRSYRPMPSPERLQRPTPSRLARPQIDEPKAAISRP